MISVMLGLKFIEHMIEAGIVPPTTRRMIIDADCNNIVSIYYEIDADEEKLQAFLDGPALKLLAEESNVTTT